MAGLPRRRLMLVLWVVLALLPLRGMAHAWMVASPAHPAAVLHAGTATMDEAHPGCHGGAALKAAAGDTTATQDDHAPACSLCDLCHNALAISVVAALPPSSAPPVAPVVRDALPLPKAQPQRLYRPPRA